ncbi:hypothetical protein SODALDRAFT_354495 [Sodiomyces alkalinus F11]|uniref:Secreted protein n=1 Tax=Sodiomyces alkalinus (strain CBS 110278 / VKM F-3762 / F11) TaxID=1314773 RepID=A0A3N2Q6E8_SODAK|nr:hypothetical protein SODALDRAFT_354495 [Sodiomyces alkalinus F11]ROT42359.1 hypothetical protein SODALDRAFT_354495 [Sodiomyces alkalinus F11]
MSVAFLLLSLKNLAVSWCGAVRCVGSGESVDCGLVWTKGSGKVYHPTSTFPCIDEVSLPKDPDLPTQEVCRSRKPSYSIVRMHRFSRAMAKRHSHHAKGYLCLKPRWIEQLPMRLPFLIQKVCTQSDIFCKNTFPQRFPQYKEAAIKTLFGPQSARPLNERNKSCNCRSRAGSRLEGEYLRSRFRREMNKSPYWDTQRVSSNI